MTATERKPYFKLATDNPYLASYVYYENFEESWPRYNGTASLLPYPSRFLTCLD